MRNKKAYKRMCRRRDKRVVRILERPPVPLFYEISAHRHHPFEPPTFNPLSLPETVRRIQANCRIVGRKGIYVLSLPVEFIAEEAERHITPEADLRSDGALERENGPDLTVETYYEERSTRTATLTTDEREEFEEEADVSLEADTLSGPIFQLLVTFIETKNQESE